MEKKDILRDLNQIFQKIFDNDSLVITENTTANDIEEWDSLTHIQLVVAVEKHFKIKFTTSEITAFKSVGDMADAVERKTS